MGNTKVWPHMTVTPSAHAQIDSPTNVRTFHLTNTK